MHWKLANFETSKNISISIIFHKHLLDVGSKILQRVHLHRTWSDFPSKGQHPSSLKCRTGAKCPLQVLSCQWMLQCQALELRARKFSQSSQAAPHPTPWRPLPPPTPQKKGGGGGEGRDLTHRGARSFGEDQWWETDRSRSRVRVISVTDPKVVIVVTFWNLKLKSQFLSLNHPPPAKKNWLFSCKIFFSLPFSDWLLQSIVVFLVVA